MKNAQLEILNQPVILPCGLQLKNRLIKSAMTEGLAGPEGLPNERHVQLYRTWAEGGAAVLITGNVMIDGSHLERPGNVILDRSPHAAVRSAFRIWADAGITDDCQMWMQLSHPGRQTQKRVNPAPKSSSDVKLGIPGGQFAKPSPLSLDEIQNVIERFASAAQVAKQSGFSGVQVDAAHGYLISQFLSPAANRRNDEWGGSLENRARFLRSVVGAVRDRTGSDFAISVKLNSSDFQKDGFGPEDARQVVQWLGQDGVDLVELSGGTYEQPKMLQLEGLRPAEDIEVRPGTREREAYFLAFAAELSGLSDVPLMVTGGFRTAAGMADAITRDGITAIGVGRPLCGAPHCLNHLLHQGTDLPRFEKTLGTPRGLFGIHSPIKLVKLAASLGVMAWYYDQIVLMADGRKFDPGNRIFTRFLTLQYREMEWMKVRRAWLIQTAANSG